LVVKSANCTVLIDRICKAHGLKLAEVPVGFKYICEKMRETDVLIGGEESGGIGFQGHIPERDGILANLMLLEMLTVTGKRLSEIARELQKEFGASFYDRIDMRFPLEKREKFIETLRTQPPKDVARRATGADEGFRRREVHLQRRFLADVPHVRHRADYPHLQRSVQPRE
jgi:phosphomannomutase